MECENCGAVSKDPVEGNCPFCGEQFPAGTYTPISIGLPTVSKEDAIERRDLLTAVVDMIVDSPLSKIDPKWKALEQKLYHQFKEEAEEYDEMANEADSEGD